MTFTSSPLRPPTPQALSSLGRLQVRSRIPRPDHSFRRCQRPPPPATPPPPLTSSCSALPGLSHVDRHPPAPHLQASRPHRTSSQPFPCQHPQLLWPFVLPPGSSGRTRARDLHRHLSPPPCSSLCAATEEILHRGRLLPTAPAAPRGPASPPPPAARRLPPAGGAALWFAEETGAAGSAPSACRCVLRACTC